MISRLRLCVLTAYLGMVLACGGGGTRSDSTPPPPPPPPPASLAISPSATAVPPGTLVHLLAVPSNLPTSSSLVWRIVETGQGQLTVGADKMSADYTPPANGGTVHIEVACTAPALSAIAEVKALTGDDGKFFRVQISPFKLNMKQGQTLRPTAKGRGRREYVPPFALAHAQVLEDVPVTWSIAEGALGGTINPTTGEYTAPSRTGVFHLVATSTQNPRVQGSMEVRVLADAASPEPPLAAVGTITNRPGLAYLEPLDQANLRAVVSGAASTAATWKLVEGPSGGSFATTGGVDNEVSYTAPSGPGTFHMEATATADPALSASTILEVNPRAGVAISPSIVGTSPGSVIDFRASVSDSSLSSVVWSSPDPAGGTLVPSGMTARYTAPNTPGTYYIAVRPSADLEQQVLARIDVQGSSSVGVKILPTPLKMPVSSVVQLQAQVTGTSNPAVTWTATGGSVTPEGLVTLPSNPGAVTVTARSLADNSKSDTVSLNAGDVPIFTSTPPVSANPTAAYSYVPTTSQSGGSTVTVTMVSGPQGAVFGAGALSWTPTPSQLSLENQFVLRASDTSGGVSFQRWTVNFRVFGEVYDLYYPQDGTGSVVRVPGDYSSRALAAVVPDGSGGWQTFPGTGTAAGTFWIPGVPPGPYWFKDGITSWTWTDQTRIATFYEWAGRPTQKIIATLPTPVTFNVTGMAPWQDFLMGTYSGAGDELRWFNFNADGGGGGYMPYPSANLPTLAATSLAATVINWNDPGPLPLVDGVAGDRPMLGHFTRRPAPFGEHLMALSELFTPAPFQMTNGSPITLGGAFSNAFPTVSADLFLNLMEWDLRRVKAHLNAVPTNYDITVDGFLPGKVRGSQNGDTMIGAPGLLEYSWANPAGLPPTGNMGFVSTGPQTVLNPFSAPYQIYSTCGLVWKVSYSLPGTTVPFKLPLYSSGSLPGTSGILVPQLNPVSLMVNGLPVTGSFATLERTGLGTSPLIQAFTDLQDLEKGPRLSLSVYKLRVSGLSTLGSLVGVFRGIPDRGNGVRLPPGIFEPGSAYVFRITIMTNDLNRIDSATGILRP